MNTTIIRFCLTACLFISCTLFFNTLQAQLKQNAIDSFIGVWKGTSLCQVKNSPCHDETVVYYITKGTTTDSCNILANKIVNGAEEEMGTVSCRFDKAKNELQSSTSNGKWTFQLKNGKLEGTLFARNSLYRKIEVVKIK